MRLFRLCILSSCALLASHAADAADLVPIDMTKKVDAALVERAMTRGQMMQVFDQAAWTATDDLLAKLPRDRRAEVGGWIVTPAETGVHVDYYGKGLHADKVLYSAEVVRGRLASSSVYPVDELPALTPLALKMRSALEMARAELVRHKQWRSCTKGTLNTIVLPPQAGGRIPVYFMSPQPVTTTFPFGGHYEIDLAADGTVASARAFTKACLNLKKPSDPDKASPVLFVTHNMDPQPTEIHVFQQLATGMSVVVMTVSNRTMWTISSGKIVPVFTVSGR